MSTILAPAAEMGNLVRSGYRSGNRSPFGARRRESNALLGLGFALGVGVRDSARCAQHRAHPADTMSRVRFQEQNSASAAYRIILERPIDLRRREAFWIGTPPRERARP